MITYRFSLIVQTERYLDLLRRISGGFNQERRLYLLDKLPEKSRDRVILLPILDIHLVELQKLSNFENSDLPSPKLREDILRLTEEFYKKYKSNFTRIKEDLEINRNQFELLLYKQFPNLHKVQIEISPTMFETVGSYNLYDERIEIYPRFDRSISQIFQLIVNAATHFTQFPHGNLTGEEWYKKQDAVKQNLISGGYDKVSDKYKGLVQIISDHTVGNLVKESVINYRKLGYPIKPLLTDLNNLKELSETELQILKCLIEQKPEILSFEEIAKVTWGAAWADKYSLYAIAKSINRIRAKLKQNGIQQNLIHTQRGKGYVLFD